MVYNVIHIHVQVNNVSIYLTGNTKTKKLWREYTQNMEIRLYTSKIVIGLKGMFWMDIWRATENKFKTALPAWTSVWLVRAMITSMFANNTS